MIVDAKSNVKHFEEVIGKGLYNLEQEGDGIDCIPQFVIKNCDFNKAELLQVGSSPRWQTSEESPLGIGGK